MKDTHKQKKAFRGLIDNLLILAVLMLLVNQYGVSKVLARGAGSTVVSVGSSRVQVASGASEAEIVSAILPKDSDTTRPYQWKGQDVTLSAQVPGNGYDMLVAMNEVTLDATQQARFAEIADNVYHPCCDSPLSKCGCKHAVAAKGLTKYLISQGYDDAQIKDEIFLWNRYWWPKHYATAAVYLDSQGVNPSDISTDEWLGPKLSTIRSGRKMKASLGI